MRDFEEKSYYEIQLDNKQLILVFLAGVTVCVLVFVLGVLVGKGKKEAELAQKTESAPVKQLAESKTPEDVQQTLDDNPNPKKDKANRKDKKDDKKDVNPEPQIITPVAKQETSPVGDKTKPADSASKKEDPAYYDLDKTDSEKPLTKEPDNTKKVPDKNAKPADAAVTKTEPAKTEPAPAIDASVKDAIHEGNKFTVQVMATGSRDKAQQQLDQLKVKGYTAFMNEEKTSAGASVFKVRVGKFADSDSAKKVATRLKQDMKLDTWVAVLD